MVKVASTRTRLFVLAAAVAAGLLLIAALLLALADGGYLRAPIVHIFAARLARTIQVSGPLRVHLLSAHPTLTAQQVVIGNPPWAAPGVLAKIDTLTLGFALPGFGHEAGLQRFTMTGATLHLMRNADGFANWQMNDPRRGRGRGLPLLRYVSVPDARVVLEDAKRHLLFDGMASLRAGDGPADPVSLQAHGELNGRPLLAEMSGDALLRVRRGAPYHFSFKENSSGSQLEAHGSLPQPFDLTLQDVAFEGSGEDLRDLYFLTGSSLPNTGAYRISGQIVRRGDAVRFNQLSVRSGDSDVNGTLFSEVNQGRSAIAVELHSHRLRLADIGLRAAGRQSAAATAAPLLFSKTAVNFAGMRNSNAQVHFTADQILTSRLQLAEVAGSMSIANGIATVAVLHGSVLQGTFNLSGKLDANREPPAVDVNLQFSHLQLAALPHHGSAPPLEGSLRASILVSGAGSSLHDVASTATGTITAQVAAGTLRESLAELAGVDLRGLGLMLANSKRQVALPCALAAFRASSGTLTAQSLIIDTEPVLITGAGGVNLGSEQLDFILRGTPKRTRILRWNAPLLLQGTLAHPAVSVQTKGAAIKFIDPGEPQQVACMQ